MREKFILPEFLKEKLKEIINQHSSKIDCWLDGQDPDSILLSQITEIFEGFLLEAREKKGGTGNQSLFFEFLQNIGYQGYVKEQTATFEI